MPETDEERMDRQIQREIKHAVNNAIQPYILRIKTLETELEQAKKLAGEAQGAGKQAVRDFVQAIGQDPDDLNDFRRLIDKIRELVELLGTGKKHVGFVFLTTVTGAILTAMWLGIKATVLKP